MRGPPLARRRLRPILLVGLPLLGLGAGCEDTGAKAVPAQTDETAAPTKSSASSWDDQAREAAIERGKAVLVDNQCRRCHEIDDLPAAGRPLDCVSCHTFLDGLPPEDRRYQKIAAKHGEAILKRYQANIVHLKEGRVPDLTGLAERVEPRWIDAFLQAPYDLRPTLPESMIRPDLDDEERRAIVRYFAAVAGRPEPYGAPAPKPPPRPSDAVLDEGEALAKAKGCGACHTFGNVDLGLSRAQLEAGAAANQLAPNLRFAQDRMRHETLVAWILDPQKLKRGTTMPDMGLSDEEAEKVALWLRYGDPKLKRVKRAPPSAPEVLEREVTYAEVKEHTLGKVCVHCHMNDYEKDPGPGNLGGLGYEGVGLSMRTYETLVQGALDDEGRRYSVLEPRPGRALPPLVEVLLLREQEHWRDKVPAFTDTARPPFPEERRGMPLGLPALTDEEKSILYTWIEQGCKGPAEVTGTPGMDDGFLVPDGPVAKNQGCEQRDPARQRPRWATARR